MAKLDAIQVTSARIMAGQAVELLQKVEDAIYSDDRDVNVALFDHLADVSTAFAWLGYAKRNLELK